MASVIYPYDMQPLAASLPSNGEDDPYDMDRSWEMMNSMLEKQQAMPKHTRYEYMDVDTDERVMGCSCDDNNDIVHDSASGDTLCSSCGIVLDEKYIDPGAEWRNYENTGNQSRCGPAMNPLFGQSISTSISGSPFDRINQLHKQNQMDSNDWTFWDKCNKIKQRLRGSGIPDMVISIALAEVKNFRELMTTRGHKYDAIFAACIQYYCAKNGCSRQPSDIARLMNIEMKYLNAAMKTLSEMEQTNIGSTRTSSNDFIPRYCTDLNLDYKLVELIKMFYEEAKEIGCIDRHQPSSQIAGCIHVITYELGMLNMIDKIAKVCNVSENTINKVRREIMDCYEYFDTAKKINALRSPKD